ncbi:UDP-N-acetylmuramoylalanyl-D-glutamate--2,6- diaminopimelate ligase [Alkalibacterium sp. AK22]|uniref:Mur ligase family protein n=1 Tax=Alkalibacterium sp. AK22 TaxID=1229520 RepID=UPI00044B5EED|nr:UDP-N-acetylmuramyl-tripeptide synthetase [Alkalibacterium sp. AK22]EXJ22613.1 UDP-N-acetylmuramoylalanyl-D-glutamate--2,6- diaminopimelate ligase [Alkalibacterium sp. AK22]
MHLSQLLSHIQTVSISSPVDDMTVLNIAYHSKEVNKDTLFVCIKGYQTDGHNYAEDAVSKGAVALVVEKYIAGLDVPQILVSDSRKSLAELSAAFYDYPSQAMRVFGITGTNGKTSITYMADSVFSRHQLKTGVIGTVMVKINDTSRPSILTTPESKDLQKYLHDMEKQGVSHVSMEVSSSALELDRTAETAFDIVAFTNINQDHIQLHGSFEAYYDAKASLIRQASQDSIAILNADEPLLNKLVEESESNVITYGIKEDNVAVKLTDIDMSSGLPAFTVNIRRPLKTLDNHLIEPSAFRVQLSIPGFHSVSNAATAILAGLLNDIPVDTVIEGIEAFKGVERRFHVLYDDEFTIIDDLLLNENNIHSSLSTLKYMTYNRLHLVHAIRGSNGSELNRKNAEAMIYWFNELGIGKITLTTSQSHVKEKDQVSDEELHAFLSVMEKAGIEVELFEELDEALKFGLDQIASNDLLLITGAKGMDHGARTCLNLLKQMKPFVNYAAVDSVLKNKMVGMKDPVVPKAESCNN